MITKIGENLYMQIVDNKARTVKLGKWVEIVNNTVPSTVYNTVPTDFDVVIDMLIEDELYEANKKFKPFSSSYEGYAVLLEKFDKLKFELKVMEITSDRLWLAVKGDESYSQKQEIEYVEENAENIIKELIQVGAMCRKFKKLLEGEKW